MKTRVGALGILIAFAQSGCAQPPPIAERAELGLVVLLPGVEGSGWQFDGTIAGLKDGGMNRPVEIIPWGTPPFQSLENLTNYGANLERAKRIAGRIVEYKGEHPDRPVTLVGYSGGGGLAIMAVEALPEGACLERLILVSAAISPEYDLTRIMSKTRHGVVSFYSESDWFVLGIGTQVFGTIDRKNTDSAGRVGFRSQDGELLVDPNLRQIAWTQDWVRYGHWGGHIGWLSRSWARDILAPEILRSSAL